MADDALLTFMAEITLYSAVAYPMIKQAADDVVKKNRYDLEALKIMQFAYHFAGLAGLSKEELHWHNVLNGSYGVKEGE